MTLGKAREDIQSLTIANRTLSEAIVSCKGELTKTKKDLQEAIKLGEDWKVKFDELTGKTSELSFDEQVKVDTAVTDKIKALQIKVTEEKNILQSELEDLRTKNRELVFVNQLLMENLNKISIHNSVEITYTVTKPTKKQPTVVLPSVPTKKPKRDDDSISDQELDALVGTEV